jgi:hypothetical protein
LGTMEDKMSKEEEAAKQTIWARRAAERIVDGVLAASERCPAEEQAALLRETARRALWHMPNSSGELQDLARHFFIENFRQPHPRDSDPPEG